MRRDYDLGMVSVIAVMGLVLSWAHLDNIVLRVAVGLPLVFVAPGYALVCAVFSPDAIDGPERVVVTCGLSLTIAALGSLLLHWTPWGLGSEAWAGLLGGITLGCSALAWRRRRQTPAPPARRPQIDLRSGLLLVVAAFVLVGVIGMAGVGAQTQPNTPFTQLSMLPDPATSNAVVLRLGNFENATTGYLLQLNVAGSTVAEWSPLELQAGQQWTGTAALPAVPTATTVEAVLYRLDQPNTVYRRVTLGRGQ